MTVGISFWGTLGLILAILVPSILVVLLRDAARKSLFRHRHIKTHASLSDEEFLAKAGIPQDGAREALAVREAFAVGTGVPASTVHPSDQLPKGLSIYDLDEVLWDVLNTDTPEGFWDQLVSPSNENPQVTVQSIALFLCQRRHLPQ
jgi:hypothetical protein